MKLKSEIFSEILTALLIISFYFIGYTALLKKDRGEEFPTLRERLGTILFNSSKDYSGLTTDEFKKDHIYCYYPGSSTLYPGKSGEYIIRKVQDFASCRGWYGTAIFKEGSWVSEIEKIWWSKQQKLAEEERKDSDLVLYTSY